MHVAVLMVNNCILRKYCQQSVLYLLINKKAHLHCNYDYYNSVPDYDISGLRQRKIAGLTVIQ